jgi:hypothetical protein
MVKNDRAFIQREESIMRKMIMLALASFVWKQFQKRIGRGRVRQSMPRR